jgi:hypothetical protein
MSHLHSFIALLVVLGLTLGGFAYQSPSAQEDPCAIENLDVTHCLSGFEGCENSIGAEEDRMDCCTMLSGCINSAREHCRDEHGDTE